MELKTEVNQRMTLSAHMQQCLGILVMDNAQLGEYIAQQVLENPILELSDQKDWRIDPEAVVHVRNAREYWEGNDGEPYIPEIAADAMPNNDLYFQLTDYQMPEETRKAAEYIIESLDSRGYFTDDIKETAKILKISIKTVREALEIIKQMEPAGIGAATLEECLMLQLEREYPEEFVAKEILKRFLDDYSKSRYAEIAKALNISTQEIIHAGKIILSLNPKPLGNMAQTVRTRYLTADLVLVKYADHHDIILDQKYIPELHFNHTYIDMLKDDIDESTRQYIRERYEKARWLKNCVKKRQETLLLVTELIFKYQNEFLANGPKGLHPLTLKTIADDMKMHLSTISRAVKGKYIQTNWGIYPLRYFFSSGIATEGSSVSPAQIRAMLEKIIQKEDKSHPYSDSRLEEILKERGLSLSRRTIASYRAKMNIPSSSVRKRGDYLLYN